MKRILANITMWAALAAVAGAQIGYQQGYHRGVRDIGTLMIILHGSAGEPPTSPSKRGL